MSTFSWPHTFRVALLALLMSVTLIAPVSHALPQTPGNSMSCKTLLVSSVWIDHAIVKELASLYLTLFADGEQDTSTQDRLRSTAIWKSQIRKVANELGVDPNQLTEAIRIEVNQRIDQYVHGIKKTATAEDRIRDRQDAAVQRGICARNKEIVKAITDVLPLPCEEITEEHLGQIESLNIKDIKGALNPKDLHGLTGLRDLWLYDNPDLTALPHGIFDQLGRLEVLTFSSNPGLTSLPPGIFDQLGNLKNLTLDSNPGLTSLAPGVFDQLRSLESLCIRYNPGLTSLPEGIFDSLRNLWGLTLEYNPNLDSLPMGIFDALKSIEHLWLRKNQTALINSHSQTIKALKKRGVDVRI